MVLQNTVGFRKLLTQWYFITLLIVSGFTVVIYPTAAQAQFVPSTTSSSGPEKIVLPDPLTPEAVRGLVSTLSDEQVRSLLLERLDAVAKKEQLARTAGQSGPGLIGTLVGSVVGNFTTAVVRIPRIWDGLVTSTTNFVGKHGSSGILKMLAIMIGAVVAGLVAEVIVNRITRKRREKFQIVEDAESLADTLKMLGSRLFWDSIALAVFFIVTRLVGQTLVSDELFPLVSLFMVQLVVVPRWTWVLSRFLNAPQQPKLRLINATDEVAQIYHRTMIGLTILAGVSAFIIEFHTMNGVALGETRLGYWLFNSVFFWLMIFTYQMRHALIQTLIGSRPDEVTPTEFRVARIYPWFAIGMTFLMWCAIQVLADLGRYDLLGGRQYVILALIVFAPLFDTMIRGLVRHLVPPMMGEGIIAENAYHSTKRSYIRIGRTILFALVVVAVAKVWKLDLTNMASAGVGAQLAGRLFEMLIILATGYLIWELVTLMFNRKLAADHTAGETAPNAEGGQGGSRLSTVLPMVRFVLQVVITVLTVLIALSNVGIDTTPLLAGAGIVGLAIGFGAQALVRDVVAGVFFLVDDAFRVGEYLVIGSTVGTVEKISLRSLQLRHHKGPVHTIPYGEIPQVTNNSRDWVITKLKFTVPFNTDINKIKKMFKVIGADMLNAPYAGDLIQTFKSQGVYDVDDVGIVIRGKFMAKPGTQWIIRKDVYSRVQKAFEENGIEFARREVRVQIPGMDKDSRLSDDQKKAVSAAASIASDTKK